MRGVLRWTRSLGVVAILSTWSHFPAEARTLRDGKLFDQAASMTQRATGAPEQLDAWVGWLGDWDVRHAAYDDSGNVHTSQGQARVTFMNRGHAFMERFHSDDFDGQGHSLTTTSFIVYNATNDIWSIGEASSFTEQITVHTGTPSDDGLLAHDAARRRGGANVTHSRLHVRPLEAGGFEWRREESLDQSNEWTVRVVKTYTRRSAPAALFDPESDHGTPAPDTPPEAREFDFLVGLWETQHDMTFPNGQKVSFPSNATGIHALDGHAIMEFNWYDVDPRLPDAATTIVRLYNRQMRRWECMFLTNRFNSILYFGGVREGDKIVLHQFSANTADTPISHWTFHDIGQDAYGWYANTSRDRGTSFEKTWIIKATRREPETR